MYLRIADDARKKNSIWKYSPLEAVVSSDTERLYTGLVIAIILIFFSFIFQASAQDDQCSYFKYCGNASQSSTSKSQPSASSSANFNPSNISNIKGLGVETMYQPNNPLGFNVVTGNGKIGGALITPTAENSFFGNRSIEIDEVYAIRRSEKKRYRTKKINIALGARILKRKNYAFDLGVSLKRNPDVKKINPGLGFSARLWFLNFGAYIYRDDTKIALGNYFDPYSQMLYSTRFSASTYTETFTTMTLSVGTQIGNLALDAGTIRTKYKFYTNETAIIIYSTAYNYKNVLFNLAYRKEISDNLKEKNGYLTMDREKVDYYGGAQYLWNKNVSTGIAYNQFLVNDISFTLTLFL